MANQCKNCHHSFEGNFCNHCGQQADVRKIDFKYIFYDLQQGLFNFDSGMLYTIKELFTRPGHSIREFLEGKRVHHFKPVSLVVILATTYAFLFHYFGKNIVEFTDSGEKIYLSRIALIGDWIEAHYTLSILAIIPLFSVASYLLFKKLGYSFAEHLILNTFMSAQRFVISIVLLPAKLFWETQHDVIGQINQFISLGLMCWVLIQFFNSELWWKALLKSVAVYLIGFTLLILLLGLLVMFIPSDFGFQNN